MPLSASILSNTKWHKFTLVFNSERLEAHYTKYIRQELTKHIRIALLLGIVMYEIYGILDFLLVPKEILGKIATIRIANSFLLLVIYGTTFLKIFKKYNQHLLFFILTVSAASVLWKITLIDARIFPFYYAGILLMIFWIHAFSILSFRLAFIGSFIIFTASSICFIFLVVFSFYEILSYIFILFSATWVSVFASYISEKQKRALFVREKELDRERYLQRELALHDYLTKLPNRALLMDRIDQAIFSSKRLSETCAGYFIDLDNFKLINDTNGHAIGDAVLIEISRRLKSANRGADTVARISGDEFFVVARDIKNSKQALVFGEKLLGLIQQPFFNANNQDSLPLSASIGVCLFPYAQAHSIDVIDRADKAMYDVKIQQKSGIKLAPALT